MYCKLFASLYQGTLRGRSHEILVFTNMLANADAEGGVDKHFRAIAEEVGLAVDEVKKAIETLEAPDPESRSPEENGARIVRMDEHRVWGWRIVNYGKYRAIRNEEDRREQNRLAQQRYREKKAKPVSKVSRRKPRSSLVEEEAEADGEGKAEERESQAKLGDAKSIACSILNHLNSVAGRKFTPVATHLSPIMARLAESDVTPECVVAMIDRQTKLWGGSEMEEYLTPETLFRKSNFRRYYDSRELPLPGRAGHSRNGLHEQIDVPIFEP